MPARPICFNIIAESIAPAHKIILSVLKSFSSLFTTYLTPHASMLHNMMSVTSASVIKVAPASTASSMKSFADHFASTGHPKAHFPH